MATPLKVCVDPVLGALKAAWAVVKEVRERMQALSENDRVRESILGHVDNLEKIANRLEILKLDELPESCTSIIDDFNNCLEKCRSSCINLGRDGSVAKLYNVYADKKNLDQLDTELKRASVTLQLVLTQIIISQGQRVQETVRQGNLDLKGDILHPDRGVYLANREDSGPRPHEINPPQVSLDGNLMKVKWADCKNPKDTVKRYEIQFDEQNNLMLTLTVEDCALKDSSDEFSVRLGAPKVRPGNLYTVRVRCISEAGPGDWSEPTIFRFKTGPPNKPGKPTVTVQSPTEVMITVRRPSPNDENGSCVTRCKVEYTQKLGGNDRTWSTLECNIKQRTNLDVKLTVRSLTPDTTYSFRIKMINGCGESIASDPRDVVTTQLIPGPPKNLRISSKRTATTIKVRWEEPAVNPQSANKYKVQLRMAKKKYEWITYATVDKKSAKIKELKTDTKYQFRVQSINNKDEASEWSSEVEAETRFGAFGRAVGTAGALVGGIVGGPVIGAIGFGAMAGAAAKKHPDSEMAKKAAGVGAGVGGGVGGAVVGLVGAPIIGGAAAIMAYKKLAGEMEDISPQTSDDENESGMWTEILKNSQKMAEDMFEGDEKK